MSKYRLTAGSGSMTDMSSANIIWSGYPGARSDYGFYPTLAGYYDLGFNFNFDGTDYSYCVIYTNGLITLGPNVVGNWDNRNIAGINTPTIAPFWGWQTMHGDGCFGSGVNPVISYQTIGSAPDRVFVVQWKDLEVTSRFQGSVYGYGYRGTWEVRLYENAVSGKAGKIEMYYDYMGEKHCDDFYGGNTGAHVGMGTDASNYLFVKYTGTTPSTATSGSVQAIDCVGPNSMANNSLLTFDQVPDVQLSSTPKVLNFGQVSAGASVDMCVTVRHAGTEGTLTFNAPTLSGSSAYTLISSPGSLQPGETGQYCIRFAPTQNGMQQGLFTIFSNGLDSGIQQIQLTGDAIAPTIELQPIGENFATRMFRKARVRLGDTLEQGIIVKNIGAGQLVVSDVTFFGDNPQYYWLSRLPDAPMFSGVSDTLFVKFSPRVEGALPAKMTIVSNASNGGQTVDLAGVGVLPRIVVTPDPMKFDSVKIGTTDTLKFLVCNPGSDTLRILKNYLSSADQDFKLIPLTGADLTIAPEKCREVLVLFTPLQMGTRVARFAVQTNIPLTFEDPRRDTATTILYYDITGTGVPVGNLGSNDIRVNGIKDSSLIGVEKCREATITNVGDADITINSATFTGAAATDYKVTGLPLPYVLKAKSSVTVQICATPTTRGSNLVSLTISGTSNETVNSLTGTVDIMGLLACVAPTPTTAFDGTLTPHNVQDSADVTITNCGDIPTAYNVTIGGADALLYSVTPTTSPVVDPNGTTTFRVYFQPTTSGLKPAVLNFTGANVTTSVTLNGTGACAILDPVAAVTAPATPANSTNTFTVSVNNSGTLPWTPGTPTITPSNAFTYVSATGTPIAPGGSGTFTFSFNPPSMNTFAAVISFPDAGECGNQVEINVSGTATQGSVESRTADGYVLTQNAPNPSMGGMTQFSYTVPVQSKVRIVLTDVTGKMIRELVNTNVATGTYDVKIETSGLASGTYLYIMEAGNARLVRQLTISK